MCIRANLTSELFHIQDCLKHNNLFCFERNMLKAESVELSSIKSVKNLVSSDSEIYKAISINKRWELLQFYALFEQ